MFSKKTRLKSSSACLAAVAAAGFLGFVLILYVSLVEVENKSFRSMDEHLRHEIRKLCVRARAEDSPLCRSVSSSRASNVPEIFVITPTYARHVQKAELTRLCHTFSLVPHLHWIVVEDSPMKTPLVTKFLSNCGVPYSHLNVATQEKFKTPEAMSARLKPPRGVRQRNAGLAHLRSKFKNIEPPPGVVYFADDDNTYDLRLFEEMRDIKGIGIWPVAFAGGLLVERPFIGRDGRIKKWNSLWEPGRPFPIDMAGFAVNLKLILDHPELVFNDEVPVGYLESIVLETLDIPYWDLEVKADNATAVLVWHTRSEPPKLKMEQKLKQPSNLGIEI